MIINAFAKSDLEIATDWSASRKEGLDLDFINEIEKAIQRIQDNPQLFAVVRKQIRMSIIKRFWGLNNRVTFKSKNPDRFSKPVRINYLKTIFLTYSSQSVRRYKPGCGRQRHRQHGLPVASTCFL